MLSMWGKTRTARHRPGQYALPEDELRPRKGPLMRAALMCGAVVMAVTTGGCWMAALQLAPMALQAAAAVGSGAAHVAEAATISSHEGSYEAAMHRGEVCDDLATEIPLLTELQTDSKGATRYRQLSLGGPDLEPQWEAMPNRDGSAQAWRTANNFTKMDFQPPLQDALTPDSTTYVAYAPAQVQNATEQNELNALVEAFGPHFGTFQWEGRLYRYAAVHKLPCFPAPK